MRDRGTIRGDALPRTSLRKARLCRYWREKIDHGNVEHIRQIMHCCEGRVRFAVDDMGDVRGGDPGSLGKCSLGHPARSAESSKVCGQRLFECRGGDRLGER